jgi:hypothetical protein
VYLAEIHGKLSSENENKEDILTSNVFSFLKYSDREIFLFQFLRLVGLEISKEEALKTEFYFWPSFSTDRTQPDVVIISGSYYLLIEAKYHSGFGQETVFKKHQLEREIEGGTLEAENLNKIFKILLVTADYFFKPEFNQDIPPYLYKKLNWINWQKIAFLIFGILDQNPEINPETRLFAEDLYNLLLKKNLRNFEGMRVLDKVGKLSKVNKSIFFQANTASYRGDFLGFLPAMQTFTHLNPSPNILFFHRQKQYFEYSEKMNHKIHMIKKNLFYNGSENRG